MASPIKVVNGSTGSIDKNDMGKSKDIIPASFSLLPRTELATPLITAITPVSYTHLTLPTTTSV